MIHKADMPHVSHDFIMGENHQPFGQKQPPPGPCGVLLSRLQYAGWAWVRNTQFRDHDGLVIDLLHCSVQELKSRLVEAWHKHVMGCSQNRKTFAGAAFMSPGLTTLNLRKMEPEQQALLRAALNGTFYTADRLEHRNGNQSTKCRFCNAEDSQTHRRWLCPYFQQCRQHLAEEQVTEVLELPAANHGWIPEPPSLLVFRTQCMQIPDETRHVAWPQNLEEELHFFTDGSCLAPTSSTGRLASWGVVLGSISDDKFEPVGNGLVPGWTQTAARAEIYAVIAALEVVARVPRPFYLWVDNDRVFRKLRLFQRGMTRITSNQKDADLWLRLLVLFQRVGHYMQSVVKVVSHQNLEGAQDEGERWVFAGNAAADRTANAAFCRFPNLMQTWAEVYRDVAHVGILRDQVQNVIVAVGQKSVLHPVEKEQDSHGIARISEDEIQLFTPHLVDVSTLSRRWSFPEANQVVEWLMALTEPNSPTRMLSWFQLNILFEHQTQLGISYKPSSKRYFLADARDRKNFVRRANNFSRWVQGV